MMSLLHDNFYKWLWFFRVFKSISPRIKTVYEDSPTAIGINGRVINKGCIIIKYLDFNLIAGRLG